MSLAENLLNTLNGDSAGDSTESTNIEEPIIVDETRRIIVPDKLKTITIYINYILPNNDTGTYIPTIKERYDDYFTFDWVIGREITKYNGGLTFLILARKTDSNGILDYQWSSLLNSECTIAKGLDIINVTDDEETEDRLTLLLQLPLEKGISENSVQQTGNTTGGKAFKFSKIDATNKKFTLVHADGSNLSLDEAAYEVGDEYSFIFVHKYDTANGDSVTYSANCKADFIGKITSVQTEIDGSVTVTVDTLHYTVKGDAAIADDYADYCLFIVPSKSEVGDILIGANAVTFGTENINVGKSSLVSGEGNTNSGMYALMGGKFNKGGYGGLIGGRNNDASANYTTAGGSDHKIKANRGAAFNLANEVLHENGTVVGMHNMTSAPNQLVGGKCADPSKEALFTLGNGSIDEKTKEITRSNAFEVLADGTFKTNKNNIQQYTNTAGAKGFKILGSYAESGGKHIYTLGSTDGLEVGQRFVTVTSTADYVGGTIDYIAGTKIRTVGDTLYELKQATDNPSTGDIYNYLLIVDRPDLGDIDVGYYAVSLGDNNIAYAKAAVALGSNNSAMGKYSTALGANNTAGHLAVATGSGTKALGATSFTGGTDNEATASNAVVFGKSNKSSGYAGVVTGQDNTSLAKSSFVTGDGNSVSGNPSGDGRHIVGGHNNSVGDVENIVGGEGNTVTSARCIVGGQKNTATAKHGLTVGQNNINRVANSIVGGIFNNQSADALLSIGNGTSGNDRSNAFEVLQDGSISIGGVSLTPKQLANVLASTGADNKNLFDIIYPIGSIYMTVEDKEPAAMFGGEWEQLQGRFLLGADDTYSLGDTGGLHRVALEENQMPRHRHIPYGLVSRISETSAANGGDRFTISYPENAAYSSNWPIGTDYTGADASHENMPPYLVVNMWKRTA